MNFSMLRLGWVSAGLLMAGCASDRVDLCRSGVVQVASDPDCLTSVFVYREAGRVIVAGRKMESRCGQKGNRVDIAVAAPDGTILCRVETPLRPGIRTRRHTAEPRFKTQLPVVVPTGSVVTVQLRP